MKQITSKPASGGMPLHFPNSALNKPRAHNRYTSGKFNTKYFMLSLFFLSLLLNQSFGATRTADQNGNWNSASTWQGGNIPTASDIVIIDRSITVTVNVNNAACLSLQLNDGGNGTAVIAFNASSQLTVSGLVTIGATGNSNRRGSINMTSGGTLICNGFVVNFVNTFTPGLGTVKLMASNILPSTIFGTFYNLHIGSGTTSASAAISVTHTFTTDAAATMDMLTFPLTVSGVAHSGILQTKNTSAEPITASKTWGGTVQFNALTGGQTLVAGTYGVLTCSNTSGTQTASGSITTTNLNLGAGCTFNASSFTHHVLGNFTNDGVLNASTSTFVLSGVALQTLGGTLPLAFNHLTIDNAAGINLGIAIAVNGNLTFVVGVITTGANAVTLNASGSLSGQSASAYVSGRFGNVYTTTGSKTFPTGKGGNYRPISINYTTLSGVSTVFAEQFESTMPGTVPPNTSLFADRYWTVTESGGSGYVHNITLDGTGFINLGTAFVIGNSGGTVTSYPTTFIDPFYTSLGLTGFSDFTLGYECDLVGAITGNDTVCAGSTSTYSIAPVGGASGYVWSVPSGASISSGQNTTSIDVLFGSTSGEVIVKPVNACGFNDSAFISVAINQLPVVTQQSFYRLCLTNGLYKLGWGSPAGGSYSGTAVSGGNFNPSTAGLGTFAITYSYTDTNTCTNTASQNIVVTSDSCLTTKVKDEFNDTTLNNINDYILCYGVTGATDYQYELTDLTDFSVITKTRGGGFTNFKMGSAPGIKYSRAYSVRVAAKVGGVFNDYGRICIINTPAMTGGSLRAADCGKVLSNGEELIYANSQPSATNYEFMLRSAVDNSVLIAQSNSSMPSFKFNRVIYHSSENYYVRVRNYANGVWGSFGDSCIVTSPVKITQLSTAYCGITLTSLSDEVRVIPISDATNYEYTFICHSGGPVLTVQRGSGFSNLFLSKVVGLKYAQMYDVQVRAYYGGSWGAMGAVCTLTTPAVSTTSLKPAYCGSSVSLATDYIYANALSHATEYEFRLTSNTTATVLTKVVKSKLPAFKFRYVNYLAGDEYDVQVRAFVDSTWGAFGAVPCAVVAPLPHITSPACGSTLAGLKDELRINSVLGGDNYRYVFTDTSDLSEIIHERASNFSNLFLSTVSGLKYNTTYSIKVQAYIGGVWTAFGSVCLLTTPPSPGRVFNAQPSKVLNADLKVSVFPNPFKQGFSLQMEHLADAPISLKMMDVSGRVLINQIISQESIHQTFGNELNSGMYFVEIAQGDEVRRIKIIKTE